MFVTDFDAYLFSWSTCSGTLDKADLVVALDLTSLEGCSRAEAGDKQICF